MTTNHRASVITAPPAVAAVLFSFGGYMFAYSLTVDRIEALIGAALGIPVGFFAVGLVWWRIYERWIPQPPRAKMQMRPAEVKPVEIHMIDGERGNVEHIYKIKSISDRQLYDVAVAVIGHNAGLTYRRLRTIGLTDEEIAAFQNELLDRRWAYRKNDNSALKLTRAGWNMIKGAERSLYQPPTPRQSEYV